MQCVAKNKFSGWIDDFHSEGTQLIARSYIERNDHNQIVLDWGQYSFSSIALAVHRSSIISKLTGQMLIKLFEHGLNANNFHCVGHSIGGRFVQQTFQFSKWLNGSGDCLINCCKIYVSIVCVYSSYVRHYREGSNEIRTLQIEKVMKMLYSPTRTLHECDW